MNIKNIQFKNDGIIVVDGKAYVKVEEKPIFIITHPNSNKEFYFAPGDAPVAPGNYVICDTMYGEKVGYIKRLEYLQEQEIIDKGAYLPLKKVIRLANHREIREAYEQSLPF